MSDPGQRSKKPTIEEIQRLVVSDLEHRLRMAKLWGIHGVTDPRVIVVAAAHGWVVDQEMALASEVDQVARGHNGHDLNKVNGGTHGEDSDETDDSDE